jgi:hypothetical protein
MNPKDREALDKFVDEDSLSPEDTKRFAEMSDGERATFIAERFFEAGAKHGRSQLNELRDDNMAQLYETIKKVILENDKLINALQFYADEMNWEGREIDGDDWYDLYEDGNGIGGRLARQVLKEVGEE